MLFETLFNGISIGSVLLIAALGLAIVFGLMGVINLAHGELMMIGGYTTYIVQNVMKPWGEPWFSWYIIISLPLAFLVSGLVGLALERGVIRHLYGRPLETLLATWGVSLILQQFVRSVDWLMVIGIAVFCLLFYGGMALIRSKYPVTQPKWALPVLLILSGVIAFLTGSALSSQESFNKPWFSARNVDVSAPAWLQGGIPIGNFQLPSARLFIIALTILCVLGVYLFFNRSNWGLRIRSVTQNRRMSACLGIDTNQVDALTFSLGSGLAGVAGCAISLLGSVGPNTGQNYIIDTFMVVVVGGVGNLLGTIIAAMIIGIMSYLIGSGTLALMLAPLPALKPLVEVFTFFATTSMAKVMIFGLIIVFLQVKPAGLFPQKGRTAEI